MTNSPLLINEPPLQVLPSLAKIIGLNEAIVLQQIHYWLNPQFNKNFFEGRHWVHNTFAQWQQQFSFWSKKTIKRTISGLEESGLLISFVTRNFKKTKYYAIDYALLNHINFPGSKEPLAPEPHPKRQAEEGCLESSATYEIRPWGQLDPFDGDNMAPWEGTEEGCCLEEGEFEGIHPGGQLGPFDEDNMSPREEAEEKGCLESAEFQGIRPWSHIVPLERDNLSSSECLESERDRSIGPTCPSRRGQLDPIERDNMAPFHYTEITSETTSEITPPLPPSSSPSSANRRVEGIPERRKEEEEEEEEDQQQHPNATANSQDLASSLNSRMLEAWNQGVQAKLYPGQPAHLTERREKLLEHFRETVLRNRRVLRPGEGENSSEPGAFELGAWRDYCALIANSRFLAGENATGFKVTLDWALKPEKAYKILEGAIYDKPKPLPQEQLPLRQGEQPWEEFMQSVSDALPPGPYSQHWPYISQHLARRMGQARYKSWFSKAYLKDMGDPSASPATAVLQVGSRFIKDYIANNFHFDVIQAIQTTYPTVKHLDFQVVPTTGGPQ